MIWTPVAYKVRSAQVRVVRIFNTYGPRMALDDGRVVSNFVAQALTGQPMTIYGDGQQTRSFQYVSDLIEGARTRLPASAVRPPALPLGALNQLANPAAGSMGVSGSPQPVGGCCRVRRPPRKLVWPATDKLLPSREGGMRRCRSTTVFLCLQMHICVGGGRSRYGARDSRLLPGGSL